MQVLKRPLITEKVTQLREVYGSDKRQYAFEVAPTANKIEIRRAIEKRFDVKVHDVRTVRVKGKSKMQATRRGYFEGRTALKKKAYITLKEGYTIDIFDLTSEE